MTDSLVTPAVLAAADQGMAETLAKLDLMVAFYRDEQECSTDRVHLVAHVAVALARDSHPLNVASLLAVALARLADAGQCADCALAPHAAAILEA